MVSVFFKMHFLFSLVFVLFGYWPRLFNLTFTGCSRIERLGCQDLLRSQPQPLHPLGVHGSFFHGNRNRADLRLCGESISILNTLRIAKEEGSSPRM